MTLLNPWGLLVLAAIPPLVLLYFLKLKRPHVDVPSTLLWKKVIEDLRVNSPFQKLRKSLLLLLQILVLCAIAFALARPLLRVGDRGGQSLIVLVDCSASMGAADAGKPTRLEEARREVEGMIDGLSGDDELMLISFGSRARVLAAFSANQRQLRDSLAGLRVTDGPTDAGPALLLAKSICASRSHPRVVLFSDGAFPEPPSLEMPVEVEYRKVGAPAANLAVTGLDIRRSLEDRTKMEMFVVLENFSTGPMEGNLVVEMNGQPLDTKYFKVGAQESLSQIFEASLPGGGDIRVHADTADALAADNTAWKVVEPPRRRRVLVVGEDNYFIDRVLTASPGVECDSIKMAAYNETVVAGHTAVIWNRVETPALADANNLYLGCVPALAGMSNGPAIEGPDVADWDHTHPLNRFIDYDNLLVSTTAGLTIPASGRVLLRSANTPLIASVENGGRLVCVVGFDPLKSNWPLLISFPLFINNYLNYCEELEVSQMQRNIAVGGVITVPAGAEKPTLRRPDGVTVEPAMMTGGERSFADLEQVGLYQVTCEGQAPYSVAANLFDRRESMLEPVEAPALGGTTVVPVQGGTRTTREYWRELLILLVVLLGIEWVVYHRRLFV